MASNSAGDDDDVQVQDASNDQSSLSLIVDVRTRWNSTYYMINRALQVKQAYNMTCTRLGGDLTDYIFREDEWAMLEKLSWLLHGFAEMTDLLEASKYPTVNTTIVVYNNLFTHIEKRQARFQAVSFNI